MPDSSKDENREIKKSVIGQFGTGFLSTHILSRYIQVSGIVLENGQRYNFQFTLDRTDRGNKNFLIESIKKAENQFRTSLKPIRAISRTNEYQTKFTYFINETYESIDGHEVVNEGLKTLEELMPYVLNFRPQIAELQVIDHRQNTPPISYRREGLECDIDNLYLVNTVASQAGKPNKEVLIGYIFTADSEIAFPLKRIQENQYSLLPYPKNCPKLFCAFPMIGTQEFSLPYVMHSENFDPNRERDGISISIHDPINRGILAQSKVAYLLLLSIIQDHQWKDAYNVCGLESSKITDIETSQWFNKNIFTQVKTGISTFKLIEMDEKFEMESFNHLDNTHIPYVADSTNQLDKVLEEIFEIFTIFFWNIPSKSTLKDWYNTVDFSLFPNTKLDLKSLSSFIDPKEKSLKELSEEKKIDQSDVFNGLNKLVKLIVEQNELDLLDKHNLICTKSLMISKLKGIKKDCIQIEGVTDAHINLLKEALGRLRNNCRPFR